MTVYVPGTKETDPAKQNRSLAALAAAQTVDETNIATNTTNIATNTTNIASNTSAITALQALVPLSKITASLGADVSLNNISNYFDGPSVAQGTAGTWLASGTVTIVGGSAGDDIRCKLWDGTTVIASAVGNIPVASYKVTVALSGYLATPAANIRISVQNPNSTTGKILFNNSGNSKDSTITAVRIA